MSQVQTGSGKTLAPTLSVAVDAFVTIIGYEHISHGIYARGERPNALKNIPQSAVCPGVVDDIASATHTRVLSYH